MINSNKLGALALVGALPFMASAAELPTNYDAPQDAVEALQNALEGGDVLSVFGENASDIILTGNAEEDEANRVAVLDMLVEGYRFANTEDGNVQLLLGRDGWPFAIPLTRKDDGWVFDVEAGREEAFFRRIGLNELETIEMMEAYVDIQSEYRLSDHDGDGVMEFASSILSSEGARDGLVWIHEDSPLGERIAMASLDGYNDGEEDQTPEPFGGYFYRILSSQSDAAPGGAMEYVIGGNMVAGHALLAVPAEYGETGVHSFMIAENGIVLEADLGEDTLERAADMTTFDPTEDWKPLP
ncbi:DUF2950 family protein [Falsihalocynthiibacter sp. SS001]|uniref:DUF2950 family protein n=1 Tax=Falsihalocynthiibacter sp. SS001 TaxID=3349698 RepID=UPI0036D3D10D